MDTPGSELDARWRNVLDHWTLEAAHNAFIQACFQQHELGTAAARYSSVADEPGRQLEAQKQLKAIAVLAMHALDSQRVERRPAMPRWLVIAAAAVCALAVAWLAYVLTS